MIGCLVRLKIFSNVFFVWSSFPVGCGGCRCWGWRQARCMGRREMLDPLQQTSALQCMRNTFCSLSVVSHSQFSPGALSLSLSLSLSSLSLSLSLALSLSLSLSLLSLSPLSLSSLSPSHPPPPPSALLLTLFSSMLTIFLTFLFSPSLFSMHETIWYLREAGLQLWLKLSTKLPPSLAPKWIGTHRISANVYC